MYFTFTPHTEIVGAISPGIVDHKAIHNEVMFFGASPEFVREYETIQYDNYLRSAYDTSAAPLTNKVLDMLEESGEMERAQKFCKKTGKWLVIDTRSHMLMPGMYPAIPGWHCDAYPRFEYIAQPDLKAGNPDTLHYICHLSDQKGGVSKTIFADEEIAMDVNNDRVWESVHNTIESVGLKQRQFADGEIVVMKQPTLHRAEKATTKGWRWWFRMSCFYKPPSNDIRKQVQVYYTEGGGW